MVDEKVIALLRCTDTGSGLGLASEEVLAPLREAALKGTLSNRRGNPVELPPDEGLINEAQTLVYPIWDGVICMVLEEAIPVG
jgi:uncharacterized protein YbaR (Trm112 family)